MQLLSPGCVVAFALWALAALLAVRTVLQVLQRYRPQTRERKRDSRGSAER